MFSSRIRKRPTRPRTYLWVEELENRALPSAVQPLPIFNTSFSTNWSGYAAETNLTSPASNAVSAVSGNWTVPTVTGSTTAYSSVWVGIDGYSSNSVEQLGTEQDTTSNGGTRYYAWYEMYPNPSVQIATMTIHPGDSMSASVTYNTGVFTLSMKDNTTGATFSIAQPGTTQARSSAEWIVEAPSSFSGVLPLANFGTATFTGAQATINGITGAIDNSSWQNTAINMVNSSGTVVIDQTSGLTDSGSTSSFSVTFTGSTTGGHGHGHGHGTGHAAADLVAGASDPQASAALLATPIITAESAATPTRQDSAVSATVADAVFAQVPERATTPGQLAWSDESQTDTSADAPAKESSATQTDAASLAVWLQYEPDSVQA